jgi:hypothetical protein
MKQALGLALFLLANPAFAHHEVIVATSMIPLASAFAAVPLAGLAAWLNHRNNRRKTAPPASE